MNQPRLRWGILGTANIARKNWQAIRNSGNSIVTAVASRSVDRARAFIDECQAHAPLGSAVAAHGSYDALLADPNVEAVYVPLPTGLRKEWVIKAASAGKHVVCEKPCSTSVADLREMLAACERNRVQFMDGVMFMHSARMDRLRKTLDEKSIGEIRRIACQFSFLGSDEFSQSNIRVDSELEPFGCLGDLGWYCVRFLLWANQWQMPSKVTGHCIRTLKGTKSEKTVPGEFSAELEFPNGSSASFYCSFLSSHQQWAHINGTHGNVFVRDFVLPNFGCEVSYDVEKPQFTSNVCDFHMQEHTQRISVNEYADGHAPSQEINMIKRFNEIVLSKKLDPHWGDISLATQRVLDQLFYA